MRSMSRRGYGRVLAGGVAMALALGGCTLKDSGTNVVNGKEQFVEHCSACHVLARAGATGTTGPDLDAAFAQSRKDGLGEGTFEGIVYQQILHPNIKPQVDPETGQNTQMPANIVTGQDARDVAAYVAQAAAVPGEDTGRLAAVGAQTAEGTAEEENGVVDIPVAAAGLAYQFADATASAGSVQFTSENPQSVDHNIAIRGNGIDEKGPVVQNSTSEVTVDLQPGEYEFYCSVPGHAEGGMLGKLTVE
jgi:plastocyanin